MQRHTAKGYNAVAGEPGRVLGRWLELSARHRDGHELPVEMTLTVTHGPSGPLFHALVHDVTAAHRAQWFAAVEAAVARGLAHAAGSRQAAAHVGEALGATMDRPVAEPWLFDGDRQVVSCAARWAAREVDDFLIDGLPIGVGSPGWCAATRPRWIPDVGTDDGSPRGPAAARYGPHVAVGVPISSGERVLGALTVYGAALSWRAASPGGRLTLVRPRYVHIPARRDSPVRERHGPLAAPGRSRQPPSQQARRAQQCPSAER